MERMDLLERTLGIRRPWYVDSAQLEPEIGVLSVQLNFESGGTFACSGCGRRNCKAYDTHWKEWRHLDFFEYRTVLHAPSPRIVCPACGIRQARLPWARLRARFTLGLEAFVADMAEEVPVAAVARFLGEHDTRLGYLLRTHLW
ncbi:MAG: transposase family protein [Gemmatimonadota bacterium]|nr:transposase family protein [Gemmatimonadota bacterium]MDE2873549.1 transposase family protein [Gemmatimonadota bacterium]